MRISSVIGLILILLGVSLFAGCSRQKTVVVPGEGKMTVKEGRAGQPKQLTIENDKGKIEINTDVAISEKEFGMPFYPGAKVEQSTSASQDTDEKPGTMKQVVMTTSDSVEAVKAFYVKAYPKANTMDMNSPEATMSQVVIPDDKAQKFIMITRKTGEDKTQIVLHSMTHK